MAATLYAKCDCEHCGNHISFPAELTGSVIACPHCQRQTVLNLTAPKPERIAGELTAADVIRAFGPPVPPTPVSVNYRISLVMVTLVMVMLPGVYLGLIGLIGFGLYYFAAHFVWAASSGRTGTGLFLAKLGLFTIPMLIGAVLVFFMIKPLFTRRLRPPTPLGLDPLREQTIFAFIARVCESVGAPMPARIELNCELNAAAGFRRGLRGLFRDELVLVIGLPLVAGLTLQEFAGVMAHEFGHFTQRFGLRLSFVVRHISVWFARVCYERDALDERLAEMEDQTQDGGAVMLAGLVRCGAAVPRAILKGLLFLGHAVSCVLLRQMEYDADSYEIKVAGSTAMERTMIKFRTLGEAWGRAYKEARSSWNTSRRVPENLPAFLVHQESLLPGAVKARIADRVGLSRTGVFGTHPADGDRIRRARQAGDPGIFHLQQPASVLFGNFDVIAKQVTMLHYNEDLELDCDASNLRSMEFYTRQPAT